MLSGLLTGSHWLTGLAWPPPRARKATKHFSKTFKYTNRNNSRKLLSMPIDQKTLKKHLSYNAVSGVFTHKLTKKKTHAGDVAGSLRSDGYICIGITGKKLLAHRLAWLYVYGEWPEHQIDHDDGNRANNRIKNLFDRTCAQNLQGFHRPRSNNTSGHRGVSWSAKAEGWTAAFMRDGKKVFCGVHDTIGQAVRARDNAKAGLPFVSRAHRKKDRPKA